MGRMTLSDKSVNGEGPSCRISSRQATGIGDYCVSCFKSATLIYL